ncbi:MAG: hypothetical protein IJO32_07275, partial [Bacilli bacterium]|nr:hypothetical protein [Bacilli bacterium]
KVMALSNDERLIGLYNEEELQEAIKEGMRLAGINEGIEKNKRDVVINMLKENIDVEVICRVTGLNEKEILNISNENK